jgi:hypothetical protein
MNDFSVPRFYYNTDFFWLMNWQQDSFQSVAGRSPSVSLTRTIFLMYFQRKIAFLINGKMAKKRCNLTSGSYISFSLNSIGTTIAWMLLTVLQSKEVFVDVNLQINNFLFELSVKLRRNQLVNVFHMDVTAEC